MSFCRNCGHEVSDGVKFCENCGAAVEVNNKATNHAMPATDFSANNGTYERQAMGNGLPEAPKKTRGGKFGKFFGIILIIALVLVIFCVITAINRGKKQESSKPVAKDETMIEEIAEEEPISVPTTVEETEETPKAEETEETPKAEEEEETPAAEEKGEATTADGVDPDLKAFLDSYEEFVDEYVAFMKKYMADPNNATSMLSEYTEIMEKYDDFAETVEKYDSSDMSTADANYYLEVTTRCSQKMLDVY